MAKAALETKAEEELGRCILALLLEEPFYGHLLSGVVRSITDQTETAAVALTTRGVELRVNPGFLTQTLRRKKERTAVIKHEALHLLFRHLFRYDAKHRDARLFNIAADLVVNQLVAPWPLPEGAILLSTFPDLGLKPDQTVEWYYKKLAGLQSELQRMDFSCAGTGDAGDGEGSDGSDCEGGADGADGTDEADSDAADGEGTAGEQGSEAGEGAEPCPGDGGVPARDYSATSAPASAQALDGLTGASGLGDHQYWAMEAAGSGEDATGRAVPESVRQALETELERAVLQAKSRAGAKAWGTLPGSIRDEILAMIERRKPKVDWKRALRLFSNSSRRTRIRATGSRESRRFGTFPGIKIKSFQRMAVAVDTSGSVPDSDLSRFFSEIHGMWRQGAEIVVIECDATVQKVWDYKGHFPDRVAGRGGTVFDPVFRYLREQRMARFDGCIYLTDGEAAPPSIKPPCKLLWVVTSDGTTGPQLKYGRTIQLPPEG